MTDPVCGWTSVELVDLAGLEMATSPELRDGLVWGVSLLEIADFAFSSSSATSSSSSDSSSEDSSSLLVSGAFLKTRLFARRSIPKNQNLLHEKQDMNVEEDFKKPTHF